MRQDDKLAAGIRREVQRDIAAYCQRKIVEGSLHCWSDEVKAYEYRRWAKRLLDKARQSEIEANKRRGE